MREKREGEHDALGNRAVKSQFYGQKPVKEWVVCTALGAFRYHDVACNRVYIGPASDLLRRRIFFFFPQIYKATASVQFPLNKTKSISC